MIARTGFRILVAAVLGTMCSVGSAADRSVVLLDPDGQAADFSRWLADNGPAVVLVWTSWAPRADQALAAVGAIETAAAERGMGLLLVAVQEPMNESRAALAGTEVEWKHDRHGSLLKRYRVIQIPSLIVVGPDGRLLTRLEATSAALRAWNGR